MFVSFFKGNNTLELPPDVESCEAALFQCIPSSAKFSTLSYFQKCLTEKGEIDLSKHSDVTVEEFDIFAMLLLALNRKTHPMKRLILDNCDLTDDKLEKFGCCHQIYRFQIQIEEIRNENSR